MDDPAAGVAELELALRYNPDLDNGHQQLGMLKLKAGDSAGAVEDFRAAIAAGANPDMVANAIFGQAHARHFQAQSQVISNAVAIDVGEVSTALELFTAAAEFAQTPETSEQIHFFIAFGYYMQGIAYDGRTRPSRRAGRPGTRSPPSSRSRRTWRRPGAIRRPASSRSAMRSTCRDTGRSRLSKPPAAGRGGRDRGRSPALADPAPGSRFRGPGVFFAPIRYEMGRIGVDRYGMGV